MDAQSVIDQLNIKVATSVLGVCDDERRGLITKAQANTALRGIFDAVSGLVSQDNFELLTAASEEYKHAKGVECTFIKGPHGIRGSIRICGAGALLSYDQGKPMRLPEDNTEREVDAEAKADQEEYHRNLLATAQAEKKVERGSW